MEAIHRQLHHKRHRIALERPPLEQQTHYHRNQHAAKVQHYHHQRALARKNAAENAAYIGTLAEHDMNGVSSIVILRSRSLASVRQLIIAGTEQPNPISIGTKERPLKPILRSSESMTNATRAMYPLSSSIDRKKNSTTITGRKLNTEPTPLNTPSIISECIHVDRAGLSERRVGYLGQLHYAAIQQPDSVPPTGPNVRKKIISIMTTNTGSAHTLCVSTASIFSVRARSREWPPFLR